jgi:hypothetical protein
MAPPPRQCAEFEVRQALGSPSERTSNSISTLKLLVAGVAEDSEIRSGPSTQSGEFPNRHTRQSFAPRYGEIKRAAMKRGGSATIAPKVVNVTRKNRDRRPAPNGNGGRRCRRPPLSLCRNLAWEARRPAPGGFEWRSLNRGFGRRFLRSPFPAEAGAGFPAGSPTRAEALAVRRSAVWNSRPSSPHRGPSAEALVPMMAGSSAEASGSA